LRFRFQIGHVPEVAERIRVKVGQGVTGRAVKERRTILVDDVSKDQNYIEAVARVRSELAVPLINKNKVIGVMDLEAREPGYFKEDHARLLTLIASRIAVSIENARLYKRIGDLLLKIIDYQMFSILLLDENKQKLVHRFSVRFKENIQIKHDIPLG